MSKGYKESFHRIDRNDGAVEAVYFSRWDTGGKWYGWIVRSTTDRFSYSDPIAYKADALKCLLEWKD